MCHIGDTHEDDRRDIGLDLPVMQPTIGGFLMRVIKSYSISLRAAQLIDQHVHDPVLGDVASRSAVVDNAILWYLDKRFKPFDREQPEKEWENYERNIAELAESQEKLIAKVRELAIEKNEMIEGTINSSKKSWWRRLLGLN